MGQRGPLAGNSHGLKSGPAVPRTPAGHKSRVRSTRAAPTVLPVVQVVTDNSAPPPPASLPAEAAEVWTELAGVIPLRHPQLDTPTLERFARLTVERRGYEAVLDERGVVLEEPIISPTGKVVGTRVVMNPAEMALRRIDRALDVLADRLGLSPVARARLGLTVSNAMAAEATAEKIIKALEHSPVGGARDRPI
jgi:phage terminase small subunit